MAHVIGKAQLAGSDARTRVFEGGVIYPWLITFGSLWFTVGLHLDSWAHHHLELETFFTPWHAVLYSGYLLTAACLALPFGWNVVHGIGWRVALPTGYGLSLLGAAIFAVGGVGDLAWHEILGIEKGIEALLSPTHLILALGGGLIIGGPFRAAWHSRGDAARRWQEWLPVAISLTLLLTVLVFFTVYANPLSDSASAAAGRYTPANAQLHLAQGVAGVLLHSAFLTGLVLLALRRWRLPFGTLTLVFGLNALFTVSPHEEWQLVPFAVLAGLAADGLVAWLRPATDRRPALRAFAFLVPTLYFALYFATIALRSGIWWSVHMWAGAIVMAGITGWLLSYLAVPPIAEGQAA